MADPVSQEVSDASRSEGYSLTQADVWGDIRNWHPRSRFLFSVLLAAAISYLVWFGLLALFDIWRTGFLSPVQLAVFVATLSVQCTLAWTLRWPPLLGGAVFAGLWSVPALILVLANSTEGDYLHATLYVLSPAALSFGTGWLAGGFFRQCGLPVHRGA